MFQLLFGLKSSRRIGSVRSTEPKLEKIPVMSVMIPRRQIFQLLARRLYHIRSLSSSIQHLLHVSLSSLKPHGLYGLILEDLPRSTKEKLNEHVPALARSKMFTENRLRPFNRTETRKDSRNERDDPKTTDFPTSSQKTISSKMTVEHHPTPTSCESVISEASWSLRPHPRRLAEIYKKKS
jgi:hypothetical protein